MGRFLEGSHTFMHGLHIFTRSLNSLQSTLIVLLHIFIVFLHPLLWGLILVSLLDLMTGDISSGHREGFSLSSELVVARFLGTIAAEDLNVHFLDLVDLLLEDLNLVLKMLNVPFADGCCRVTEVIVCQISHL